MLSSFRIAPENQLSDLFINQKKDDLPAKLQTGAPMMIESTQRIARWAGLILCIGLSLVLIPARARAGDPLTITVRGVDYAISYYVGSSFNDKPMLEYVPWFSNDTLAGEFRDAVSAGTTTAFLPYDFELRFAYQSGQIQTGEEYIDTGPDENGIPVLVSMPTFETLTLFKSVTTHSSDPTQVGEGQ